MPPIPLRIAFLAGLLVVAIPPASAKLYDIIVNAEADGDYAERTKDLAYQTYHFVKGKVHLGSSRSNGLEVVEFDDLAESLTDVFKDRDLYLEHDKSKGDLMIMISWGTTALDANVGERQYEVGGNATAKAKNMMLLGLEDDLNPDFETPTEREFLWDALKEERYFVVLNAFDYQRLLKNKELKQVWCVRYNAKALDMGFRKSIDSMNQAVSGLIGKQLNTVTLVKGDTAGGMISSEVEVNRFNEVTDTE